MAYTIIMTTVGLNKQAAWEGGGPALSLTHMAVGDSNGLYYDPDPDQTALVHEVWRGFVYRVFQHPTLANRVVIEATIPATVGGWDVREVGIFDGAGDLILVGSYPLTNKPSPGSGAEKELTIQAVKQLTNTAAVTLVVDSTAFVSTEIFQQSDWKNSVRAATTGNITLSGLQTIDGVSLADGDSVLVKDQTTATGNGIYVAKTGAWIRRTDANTNAKVTANLAVSVEEGTENGSAIWMLSTDNPIVLDTTALEYTRVYPVLTAVTQPQGDCSTKLANTEFVQNTAGANRLYFYGQI